jgi:hypothetical protein
MKKILGLSAMIVAFTFLLTVIAMAHSWYDSECCSGYDCAVAIEINLVTKMARTSQGSAPIDDQTKIKESKDSKTHACIRYGRVVCLYLAPQT